MDRQLLRELTQAIPPKDPAYLVGEEDNWLKFDKHLTAFQNRMYSCGGTIQGVSGNGKTHFIRYAKNKLKGKYNIFLIEDMFSQSDFKTSLRDIYKRLIHNDYDNSNSIENITNRLINLENELKKLQEKNNRDLFDSAYEDEVYGILSLKKFPSRILSYLRNHLDDPKKLKVLIKYFSGEDITNKDEKSVIKDLNLTPNLINSESDFVTYFVDYLELVYALSNKPVLIFMDEADRAVLLTSSKTFLPKVGFQLLDSLREVFNKVRTPTLFTIGTTTQAWQLISNSAIAFARRFNEFHIILKEKKTSEDVKNFIIERSKDLKIDHTKLIDEDLFTDISISASTWQDVLDSLKLIADGKDIKLNVIKNKVTVSTKEIESEILNTLFTFRTLSGKDIISNNTKLLTYYPTKELPVRILNSLVKRKLIERFKANKSSAYIYKISPQGDDAVRSTNK